MGGGKLLDNRLDLLLFDQKKKSLNVSILEYTVSIFFLNKNSVAFLCLPMCAVYHTYFCLPDLILNTMR
jgi:hypothetical protein